MTPTQGAIEAALATLFPVGVAVAAEPIVLGEEDRLVPGEEAAIAGAVAHRRAEFVAGRTAARRALALLGLAPVALPMGPDRAAIWPAGLSGSIAHAAGFAVAVVRSGPPVGVDIEADTAVDSDLWPIICLPDELQRLSPRETGLTVKRLFCAKEAVFKAQPADQRALFGHETLSVTLAETHFDAQFVTQAGAFRQGQIVRGRIMAKDGLILAGVAL